MDRGALLSMESWGKASQKGFRLSSYIKLPLLFGKEENCHLPSQLFALIIELGESYSNGAALL